MMMNNDNQEQNVTNVQPGDEPKHQGPEHDGDMNETLDPEYAPNVHGEQSVSGDMPDPESDDDTVRNAHIMGLVDDPSNAPLDPKSVRKK